MTRRRVLVVDDVPEIRKSMSRFLRMGCASLTVETAENAQQALEIVREGSGDRWFIISDWDMPANPGDEVHDGPSFIRKVRGHDPRIDAKIMLMSGLRSEDEMNAPIETDDAGSATLLQTIGADEYLHKTSDKSPITAALQAFMARED